MIEFKDVNLTLNNKNILNNISFAIPENCNTVIIGKSGCGKTVLMKTLEGLYRTQSGIILVDGEEVNVLNYRHPNLNIISMLFQYAALLDSFTVYQNVALPLVEKRSLSKEIIRDLVMNVLQLVGLESSSELYPAELSGGMKKRIGLARALVMEPKYLILDEPTTGLDPFTSEEVLSLLNKVIEQKQVIPIIITHDPYCIDKMGDYVIIIDSGHVTFCGSRSEIENCSENNVKLFFRSFFNNESKSLNK